MQRICITPASSVSINRCPHYIYFGNPSNVVYQGTNFDNNLISYAGLPYPYDYVTCYRLYSQMIYMGLKYKAIWYRDIESATKLDTTMVHVGYTDQGPMNPTATNFPFDQAFFTQSWCDPRAKFKIHRSVPTNALESVTVSISGRITARQFWGQPINQDRFKVPTVLPGFANTTVANINNGVGTRAVGTVCFQQFFPDLVAPLNQQWSQLWLELEHDIYFFDPRPIPLTS